MPVPTTENAKFSKLRQSVTAMVCRMILSAHFGACFFGISPLCTLQSLRLEFLIPNLIMLLSVSRGEVFNDVSFLLNRITSSTRTVAKFAIECMMRMQVLASELEVVFGPDTGDLSLRIGIHSGTITGGFLKGKGVSVFVLPHLSTPLAIHSLIVRL